MEEFSDDPRTELCYHANVVILGSNLFVFESNDRTCDVQTVNSDLFIENNVPIVDRALVHDLPGAGEVYFLVFRNVLHIH